MDGKGWIRTVRNGMRKHAPEFLVYGGVGGAVVGAVLACLATRKLDPVLEDHRARAEEARGGEQEQVRREMTKVYLRTGVEIARLYGTAAAVEAVSVAGILAGNDILRKRNVALAAAYATLDAGFKTYRSRVVERFGEEADRELRFGGEQRKIESTETDETGKTKKTRRTVSVLEGEVSGYARYFAPGESHCAETNNDYNRMFLEAKQKWANYYLRAKKFLFLNEIYDELGFERSAAGQAVGWVWDESREDHGDNYVDFRMQKVLRRKGQDTDEFEEVYLLDFNVDGAIVDHSLAMGLITH